MSISTQLNLVSDTKPVGGSVVVNRRQRVIKSINTQISQINDDVNGDDTYRRKKPSWYWLDENGVYFVSLRYGKQAVELSKGKYSVQCQSLEEVASSLEVLREYVSKGEYDDKLSSMAKSIRSNFKR